MPTFRDDVVRAGRRLRETVEERTGREVIKREDLQLLEAERAERRVLQKTLKLVGWEVLNYQPGDPGGPGGFELRADVRRFAAQQSLTAWLTDPLAGQSVDLYVSFVFGRGVPRPQANDPEVQAHLDATWDDPHNQRILTSFDKLVEKGIDLCVQSTVGFMFFDDGEDGMCRLSLKRFSEMEDVIRHDELAPAGRGDRFRLLYVKCLERRVAYDFTTGARQIPVGQMSPDETARTVYHEIVGAFDDDDAVMAVQDEGLRAPPEAQMRSGKVYLLTVNKTSEMAFGVPRMRRIMNWYGAYNDMLVSFRDRMKAMTSVYMQATVKGNQRDLDRIGQMAVGRASAFGAAQDVEGDAPRESSGPQAPGVLGGNESLKYEPFKIDSSATDVAAAAPIMRSQVTGPWPDGYMSGNADATVGGGQSLELPTLKFVQREQEVWNGLLRAFGRSTIDAAVRVGDISEWREPTQRELEQLALAETAGDEPPIEVNGEGQVRRDLSFTVSLPDPLKRAMNDIVSAVQTTVTMIDPNGENHEASRWAFAHALAEAFDVEDPMAIVDEVLPRHADPEPQDPKEQVADPEAAEQVTGAIGADGDRHPADNPNGVPLKAPAPEDRQVRESAREERDELVGDGFEEVLRVVSEHLEHIDGLPAGTGA